MNRRKAMARILLIAGGSMAAYSGYKWWDWNKRPDIVYLEQNKDLIAALAETIIPATDSPGAKEAGVQEYIIMMVKDCTEKKSQNKFIDGLKELEHYCSSSFSKTFQQCSTQQQQQTLNHFEERGKSYNGIIGKVENRFFGKSFFATLKSYAVEGYCTSEAGATKGLAYLYIPGKFIGCMPLQPGQKSWATH
jgi:hypothetical protein